MKKLTVFLTIALLVVMVMTSCEDNPVKPIDKPPETIGKIMLVPLGDEALSKIVTRDDGAEYLPHNDAVENLKIMGRIAIIFEEFNAHSLAKIASAMIEFGEINATTGLMFVLMNTGNVDVLNVQFSTSEMSVTPDHIGVIKNASTGTEVSALPIITLTQEHVIPVSGVGSLLEMSIGEFTDTLTISYDYEVGGDTTNISDNYDISGTKMGAIIDVFLSGTKIEEYNTVVGYHFQLFDSPWSNWVITNFWPIHQSAQDTSYIINSGNAAMQIRIGDATHDNTLLDQVLFPGDTLNTTGVLANTPADSTGQIILIGDIYNQPYIFKMAGQLITNGFRAILFDG